MENALDGAKPVFSREREEDFSAWRAFGSGLPAVARECNEETGLPGLLEARGAVLFFGELYPLACWRLDFIRD